MAPAFVSSTLLPLQSPTSTPTFVPEPPQQASSTATPLSDKNTQPTAPPPSFSIWIVIFLAAIVAVSFMILLVRCARKKRLSNQIVEKETLPSVGPNTLTPLYIPLAANAMRPNNDPIPPLANKFESSLLAHGDSPSVSQYRPALIRGISSTRKPAGAPGGGLPSQPRPWSLRATQA